jgi:hypothetical protein
MAVADRHGLPVAICVESATPHEVKLATNTLVQMVIPEAPQNLIGDNAYDSDKLNSELRRYGIELRWVVVSSFAGWTDARGTSAIARTIRELRGV